MSRKRKAFICGNWKMNKTQAETGTFLKEFTKIVKNTASLKDVEIGVAPVFTSLISAKELLNNSTIKLCSQNVHWDKSGQFTGEISAPMLKEIGVDYAIIGHSERRKFFGETDETVNKRIKCAFSFDLPVIMCIGETLEERESNKTKDIVLRQLKEGLKGFSKEEILKYLVIAYEPVWAIGTGKNATVEQAVEVHQYIRRVLDDMFGKGTGDVIKIQYGGSVKPDNIDGFMAQPDIDGALVGGASLEIASFTRIVDFKK
jgi:triosephosphate isomerase (TIM)